MYRIILMVVRLCYKAPYYMLGIWWCGKNKKISDEKAYAFIQKVTRAANKAGRVTIKSYGTENIPKEQGFVFFQIIKDYLMYWCFWNPARFPLHLLLKKKPAGSFC